MIEFMHNINIMHFPDEIIRTNKQTGNLKIVLLRIIVRGSIEPTVTQLEWWAVSDNGASEAINMYEANDIWMQHGSDPRVKTCRRMIWLRRVGMFPDYKIAHSKDFECTVLLDDFSPADALHVKYSLSLRVSWHGLEAVLISKSTNREARTFKWFVLKKGLKRHCIPVLCRSHPMLGMA
jgi:hypothetical protein